MEDEPTTRDLLDAMLDFRSAVENRFDRLDAIFRDENSSDENSSPPRGVVQADERFDLLV